MILLSMKTYLALLWGISVLFSMESRSASIPETSSSISSTAEPNKTTKQLTTAHVLHNETEMQLATRDPTHSPAEVATVETTVSATVETEEAVVSNNSTGALVVITTEAATTTSSVVSQRLPHTSTDAPVVTTAASEAQPSHNTTISGSAKPTEQQQSPTTFTDMTAPSPTPLTAPSTTPSTTPQTPPAATSETSSPMSTYITELNVTNKLYSTASSDNSTQAIQNFSSPSALRTTTTSTNTTSEASHVFDHDSTSSPVKVSETSTASTELSSTSQPVSNTRNLISTSHLLDTARPSSTTGSSSNSTDSANSTTAVSTSLAGVLIPHVPKRLPIPTNKSTPATTTAKNSLGTEVKTCSIHGVVKHCLIAIASLAGLATIFIVTTIVLCTKLSARKYKVKKPQHETEMICISSLLSERPYTRQRSHPISNGILVLPSCEDSDEDTDDNLTLHSFLPGPDSTH